MKIETQILSGAGNTFHIVFDRQKDFDTRKNPREAMREAAKIICEKNGADGFIFLESADKRVRPEQASEFKWTFFNSDGSDAEMCGNATRCVGYFLVNEIGSLREKWILETVRGMLEIRKVSGDVYSVKMPAIQQGKSQLGFYCDTGVPHLVLPSPFATLFDQLQNADFKEKSSKLRFHDSFGTRGTNVTYVEMTDDAKKIKAASYERGVEGFTQACGTGAVAAAFYNLTTRGILETAVEMPGGTLTINIQNISEPVMTGPAKLLEKHTYEIEI